jgi:transporter family protein
MIALTFWGITGVTQKLATNFISARLSFLWFSVAFIPIALAIIVTLPLDWSIKSRVFWLAVIGGTLNGLGVMTSFAALESGGKTSIVIPLVYLYPLLTIILAVTFLGERPTAVQIAGIFLAIVAAILLSREDGTLSVNR